MSSDSSIVVDSHCHLDYLARDGRLDDAVAHARQAGVAAMLTIGTKVTAFEEVRSIAEQNPNIWCSVGVHPHEAAAEPLQEPADLVALTEHPKVIGIGESGLDYYYEHSPRAAQQASFRNHIAACRESGLPLIVHTRDADDDTARILREEMEKGPYTGLIHCFSTSRQLAEAALELGLYISVAGILTFRRSDKLRAIVADVPLDRLLVETDAPYLAPVPYRGKPNEPAYVVHTAKAMAEVKGVDFETLAAATTDNFFRLFSKAKRPEAAASAA